MPDKTTKYFPYEYYIHGKEPDIPYDKFVLLIDAQHKKYELSFLRDKIIDPPPRWLPKNFRNQFQEQLFCLDQYFTEKESLDCLRYYGAKALFPDLSYFPGWDPASDPLIEWDWEKCVSKIIEIKKYEYFGVEEFQKAFPNIDTEKSVDFHIKQITQCQLNNDERKREAIKKKAPIRALCEELRQKHPNYSKTNIAKIVQNKYRDYSIRTITDLVPDKIK